MKKNLQTKLDDIRQQPEHVRIRTAAIFSAIGGLVILLIWMFGLLPLELASKRKPAASSAPSPTVAGTTSNTTNPVYAITPTPVVTQVFQALPSNSPTDTTSPSPSPSFSSLPVATAQPK